MPRNIARVLFAGPRLMWSVGFAVLIFAGTAFLFAAFGAPEVLAQTQQSADTAAQVAQEAGIGDTSLPQLIGRIINIFLGLLGVILLVLLIYAGFLWMTAGGDETKVAKAKLYIRNAIIGLVIIAAAWAIVAFVFNALLGIGGGGFGGGGGGGGGGAGGGGGGFPSRGGSLGGGIVENHVPSRNARDVARNTAIIVTFKEPIALSSLIRDYNDNGTPADTSDDTVTEGVNTDAVAIYPTGQGPEAALTTAQVRVRFTEDRQTFIFRPVELLGNPSGNTGYTVELRGGRDGVLLENGDLAFGGSFASGYEWAFEVGTVTDERPPQITSVVPRPGGQYARNVVVQINFNEAIDPTSATGFVNGGSGFQNIRVHAGGANSPALDGEYRISNRYRTIEFIPSENCGTNSCGVQMFCLPGSAAIDARVVAATLEGAGPAAQFLAGGYDGVVDMAGNSFDGNENGTTDGQGADDYTWAFGTAPEVNLAAPTLEMTIPPSDPTDPSQSNIDFFAPVIARFNTLLLSSSVNTENAYIEAKEPADYADTFWWRTELESLTSQNQPVTSQDDPAMKSQVSIVHRAYASSTEYHPFLLSGIQDVYQNCFNPTVGPGCPAGPGGANCCQGTRQAAACAF